MSRKHPIIAVTGSSGAGTSTVMQSFQHIFRREGIKAQVVEGDSFHRYNRYEMRTHMKEAEASGNKHYSHFGPYSNLLEELEALTKACTAPTWTRRSTSRATSTCWSAWCRSSIWNGSRSCTATGTHEAIRRRRWSIRFCGACRTT